MRPVQGLLMGMSSREALLAAFPNRRPVVISRSGSPGSQRHCVQTWSGDNRTSWRTLKVR
jgi:alpha-glucosidase